MRPRQSSWPITKTETSDVDGFKEPCSKLKPKPEDLILLPPWYAGPWAQPIENEARQAIYRDPSPQIYRSSPAPLTQDFPIGTGHDGVADGLLAYIRRTAFNYRVTFVHREYLPPNNYTFLTAPTLQLWFDSHLQQEWNDQPSQPMMGGEPEWTWQPTAFGQSKDFDTSLIQCAEIIASAFGLFEALIPTGTYTTTYAWFRFEILL